MAAIAHVFTVGYVANLLGEDEDWLHELSTDMFPEDGCLWVYGVGETAFPPSPKTASRTCARSWSINEPPAAHRYRSNPPNSPALRCSPHGYSNPCADSAHATGGLPRSGHRIRSGPLTRGRARWPLTAQPRRSGKAA
jgi:hypothetical protein